MTRSSSNKKVESECSMKSVAKFATSAKAEKVYSKDNQILLRNETQNQKEMDMKIFIFDKMEPRMEP